MYNISISLAILLVAINVSNLVSDVQAEPVVKSFDNLSSLTSSDTSTLFTRATPGVCNVDSVYADAESNKRTQVQVDNSALVSMEYINEEVKGAYNTMRDKVISHVKAEVVLSLLNFNVNGFAPENIAAYVSDATKPFLPFKFANGVNIIDVTHKDKTIVYKAEIPIHKNHNYAVLLTKAGIASATTKVCNDSTMVEDLLERHVVIQYDYSDSNGVFVCSFNIKGGCSKHATKLDSIS